MRFIPVKSIEQQSMLCAHRLREGIKEDRTACVNRIRGLLAELGLVFAQGAREPQLILQRRPRGREQRTGHAGAADAAASPDPVA